MYLADQFVRVYNCPGGTKLLIGRAAHRGLAQLAPCSEKPPVLDYKSFAVIIHMYFGRLQTIIVCTKMGRIRFKLDKCVLISPCFSSRKLLGVFGLRLQQTDIISNFVKNDCKEQQQNKNCKCCPVSVD